jgi:uncharacterized protein YwgA
MDRAKRIVIISRLAGELLDRGSWCGETHLQKSTFLLQELTGVNPGFEFTLYRHGPFSFDLRSEINEMIGAGLLAVEQHPPYGPSLIPSEDAVGLQTRFARTVATTKPAIEFVADAVSDSDVNRLERLATALYLLRLEPSAETKQLVSELRELKPHIDAADATSAIEEMRSLQAKAGYLQAALA